MKKILVILIICSVIFHSNLYARTLYVDGTAMGLNNGTSWANAYKYLNDALNNVNSATTLDTVLIANGIYYPTGIPNSTNRDSTFGIFRTGIALYGCYPNGGGTRFTGDGKTILSGNIGSNIDTNDNSYHVVAVVSANNASNNVLFDGLTIEGGQNLHSQNIYYSINGYQLPRNQGSGVIVANCDSITTLKFNNCIIQNNGIGQVLTHNSSFCVLNFPGIINIDSCHFKSIGNYSNGGIWIQYIHTLKNFLKAKLILNNSIIERCNGYRTIYFNADSVSITNTTFKNNKNRYGMFIGVKSLIKIENCTYKDNEGMIQLGNWGLDTLINPNPQIYSDPVISLDRFFIDNSLTTSNTNLSISYHDQDLDKTINIKNCVLKYASGLGLRLHKTTANIQNCVFIRDNVNAGRYILAYDTVVGNIVNVYNATFFSNHISNNNTPSLFETYGTNMNVFNSIIYDLSTINNRSLVSTIQGGTYQMNSSTHTGSFLGGINNNSLYPMFNDTTNFVGADGIWGTVDDGLNIVSCSPMANSGNNAYIFPNHTTDIMGQPRIIQTTVDRGAYEADPNNVLSPSVSIEMPTDSLCQGFRYTLNARGYLAGTLPTYQWYVNSTLVHTGNPFSYVANNGDIIYCILYSNVPCAFRQIATSRTVTVSASASYTPTATINVIPSNSVQYGQLVNFTVTTTNTNHAPIVWLKNGIAMSNISGTGWGATAGVDFINGDIIQARIIPELKCSTIDTLYSNPITMTISNSIEDVQRHNIRIFPNPAFDEIRIDHDNKLKKVELLNLSGQIILEQNIVDTQTSIINLKNLPQGIFILKGLFDTGEFYIKKIEKR